MEVHLVCFTVELVVLVHVFPTDSVKVHVPTRFVKDVDVDLVHVVMEGFLQSSVLDAGQPLTTESVPSRSRFVRCGNVCPPLIPNVCAPPFW